jgi:hypothetical protein
MCVLFNLTTEEKPTKFYHQDVDGACHEVCVSNTVLHVLAHRSLHSYNQLVATRAMLGLVEAGLFPGVTY